MNIRTIIRIIIISVVFTITLVWGIKAAAEKEAAGAPPIMLSDSAL